MVCSVWIIQKQTANLKIEHGRTELRNVVKDLQMMIGTLHALFDHGVGSVDGIFGVSENSRIRAISALTAQFQRLADKARIPRALPAPNIWSPGGNSYNNANFWQGFNGSSVASAVSTVSRANQSNQSINGSSLPVTLSSGFTYMPTQNQWPQDYVVVLTTCPFYDPLNGGFIERGRIKKGAMVLLLDEESGRAKIKFRVDSFPLHERTGWVRARYISTTRLDPAPAGFAYSLIDVGEKKAEDLYRIIDPNESPTTWRVRHVETGERLSVNKEEFRT